MRQEFTYPQATAVFCSPLRRCTQTAQLLYPGANPIILDGLKEYFFGDFENKTPVELENHPVFSRWIAGENGLAPPFGEDPADFQRRICATFKKLCDGLLKTGTAHSVVVTHGGVLMALLAAFGLPAAPMHEWLTPAGTGFVLRLEPTIWLRGQKCEVFALAPTAPKEDALPEERRLWKELEDTEYL
jgi:alpha-ribazole phosphatase